MIILHKYSCHNVTSHPEMRSLSKLFRSRRHERHRDSSVASDPTKTTNFFSRIHLLKKGGEGGRLKKIITKKIPLSQVQTLAKCWRKFQAYLIHVGVKLRYWYYRSLYQSITLNCMWSNIRDRGSDKTTHSPPPLFLGNSL